jgi:hypothetical protein
VARRSQGEAHATETEELLVRTRWIVVAATGIFASLAYASACSSSPSGADPRCIDGQKNGDEAGVDCGGVCPWVCGPDGMPVGQPGPNSMNGIKDDGETDVDCGGPNAMPCGEGKTCAMDRDCTTKYCHENVCRVARSDDNVKNGQETDVDCGGPTAPKCAEGKACLEDTDCNGACNYDKKCVDVPSCKPHLGGDTCGLGEVGAGGAKHESCCRTLPVVGFTDPKNPGKKVYLDKYEITAGRVRAFLADVAKQYGGKPNVREWIASHTPPVWDASWNKWLPTGYDENDRVLVRKELLGDPRGPEWGSPIPPEDQNQNTGVDFQFNGQLFVYLHGNNCSTHKPTAYGFPTWYYPPEVLAKMGELYPPRADGVDPVIPASEHLDVRAINCIPNALLAAFCHWDGGQLATDDVMDFVTDSPPALGSRAGCGTQLPESPYPNSPASTTGGRCADLAKINATFDAGGNLPTEAPWLSKNNYAYPWWSAAHDKAWEISAPGRGSIAANGQQVDMVRINSSDEPWMDLAGNVNESVLNMNGATFTGTFGLKFRGIGYQSARSELNFRNDWPGEEGVRRIERPEARAGFAGGRCMRFR